MDSISANQHYSYFTRTYYGKGSINAFIEYYNSLIVAIKPILMELMQAF